MSVVKYRLPLLSVLLWMGVCVGAPKADAKEAADAPFVVEHTYWVKPGRSLQFVTLYKRSEVPKLDAWVASGKLRGYRISQPVLTSSNGQWDYRVTLFWRDAATAIDTATSQSEQRKADANDRYEDQLMLELVVDHNEEIVREVVKGATPG
jgi:hypothetical protein